MADRLLLFTRYPRPGRVKTRLIPVLGPEGAAALHRDLTEHALGCLRPFALLRGVDLEVRGEGEGEEAFRGWLGEGFLLRGQGEGDLGARMERALAQVHAEGARRAVLVGSDCPGITPAHLERAFAALRRADLVLGPARDGGYWLVGTTRRGFRRAARRIFAPMPWGTGEVLSRTVEAARSAGVEPALLDTLGDVDRPEDLPRWEEARRDHPCSPFRDLLSVVIPTLNEGGRLAPLLEVLGRGRNLEVVVADGGSRDGTAEEARTGGARVVSSPPGRAVQMNAGAAEARGTLLLFLHADTLPPAGYDALVRHALSRPGVAAGAFAFATDWDRPAMRLLAALVNLRSRLLGLPYGDQGLFLRTSLFRRVGGFPDLPVMEDFRLVRRLAREGRVLTLPAPAVTSARLWRRMGVLRVTLLHQVLVAGHLAGVSPGRLSRWRRSLLPPR